MFPDCQNVSGIGLLNKKACLFCLLNQSDLETLVIKQKTWYFLLNTQKRAPLLFNKHLLSKRAALLGLISKTATTQPWQQIISLSRHYGKNYVRLKQRYCSTFVQELYFVE